MKYQYSTLVLNRSDFFLILTLLTENSAGKLYTLPGWSSNFQYITSSYINLAQCICPSLPYLTSAAAECSGLGLRWTFCPANIPRSPQVNVLHRSLPGLKTALPPVSRVLNLLSLHAHYCSYILCPLQVKCIEVDDRRHNMWTV